MLFRKGEILCNYNKTGIFKFDGFINYCEEGQCENCAALNGNQEVAEKYASIYSRTCMQAIINDILWL